MLLLHLQLAHLSRRLVRLVAIALFGDLLFAFAVGRVGGGGVAALDQRQCFALFAVHAGAPLRLFIRTLCLEGENEKHIEKIKTQL